MTTVTSTAEPSRTWGTLGQTTGVQRQDGDRPRTRAHTLGSASQRTVPWPFQSSSSRAADSATIPTLPSRGSTMHRRRGTSFGPMRPASSVLDMDIVPDYIINFMRGETPETLARKRRRRPGAQSPEFREHTHKRSCTADFCAPSPNTLQSFFDDPEKAQARSPRYLKRIMTGWRGGVTLNLLLAAVFLIAAVACLAILIIRNGGLSAQTTIREGDCDAIRQLNTGLHVVVNLAGAVLLAGASYVFQVLTSPTREEVDVAHRKRQYLDIGVPSIRNLIFISKPRALIATLILPLAVGSQVIYNSLMFVATNEETAPETIDRELFTASSCSLEANGPLVAVIAVLNLLIVVIVALALAIPSLKPLITLGDAIASFLVEPDPTTEDCCLMSKADAKSGQWERAQFKQWTPESYRWVQTPSIVRWAIWAVCWIVPTGATGALLALTLSEGREDAFDSFGTLNSIYDVSIDTQQFALAMIVSLPHILLAVLYLSTNALLTMFFLSHEFSQFAIPNKFTPLRVSNGQPIGSQATSLFITLPRPYSWLLLLLFISSSFMLSQGMYLVSSEGEDEWSAAIGVSPLPLAVLLGLLIVVGGVVLGLSIRSADPSPSVQDGQPAGNPLTLRGGSCSAVISAKCHRTSTETRGMALHALSWGVVGGLVQGSTAAHASFSTGPVGAINVGEAYA
ncbi:hypothetical protein S40285_06739 [Stachybotrys chlorohalonatus IBT 40285]|uniref:DUF6536 domain-containing protein n=1 Tax=Stachybotrys chlorohalonatus (strain IBT 40285) TaxID=1283841 RepID=A0A084QJD5_STAC4|nr:hypothetical protein S40285_06739 [Stachybotrys chlorohalonata IBT 40285]